MAERRSRRSTQRVEYLLRIRVGLVALKEQLEPAGSHYVERVQELIDLLDKKLDKK